MTAHTYAPEHDAADDAHSLYEHVEPADRLTRLLAAIVDGVIFTAMCYLPFYAAMASTGALDGPQPMGASSPLLGLGVLLSLAGLVAWIAITVRNVVANGQTIAKKMLHIKVVRSDGSRASLSRIFWLRNFANVLLGVIPLYSIVDVLLIFGADRQCIHDKIADTIVVKA